MLALQLALQRRQHAAPALLLAVIAACAACAPDGGEGDRGPGSEPQPQPPASPGAPSAEPTPTNEKPPPAPPPGTVDTTFGKSGTVTLGDEGGAHAIAILPGDAIAVGYGQFKSGNAVRVVKATAAGVVDATFGDKGTLTLDRKRLDAVGSLRAAPKGGLFAGLDTDLRASSQPLALGLGIAKITDAGLVGAFGNEGYAGAKPSTSAYKFAARSVLELADGSIVVGGRGSRTVGYGDAMVSRWRANGTLDPSFASGGIHVRSWGESTSSSVEALLPSGGGLRVVAFRQQGSSSKLENDVLVMQLTNGGEPDATFGNQGVLVAMTDYSLRRAVPLAGGGVMLIGNNWENGFTRLPAASKLTPQGAVDTAFGTNGKTAFEGCDWVYDLAVDSKERALVAVRCGSAKRLVRLLASGAVDASFGSETGVALSFDPHVVGIDTKDRVIVVGADSTSAVVATRLAP